MIEFIKGNIASLTPTDVVLETAGGVAYRLEITLPAFSKLEGKTDAKILVHESIREDAWVLFGFIEERERALFRSLIGVSGVGSNTARMLLSAIPAPELEQAIVNGDTRRLKSAKGIGAKTAERIIVDLKDKIKLSDSDDYLPLQGTATGVSSNGQVVFDEASTALVMLGFPKTQVTAALKKIFGAQPDIKVEEAIRKALSML